MKSIIGILSGPFYTNGLRLAEREDINHRLIQPHSIFAQSFHYYCKSPNRLHLQYCRKHVNGFQEKSLA
jgi:hypothetical protein